MEGVDHALQRRRAQLERLSTDLLDLEAHPGHRLLDGAELRGQTRRRWDEARAGIVTLWWLFDAYRRTLERAEEIRSRRSRPGTAELAELTALLTGASVEMKVEDVPVERRSLVRSAGEWLTLDQVLTRMDATYRDCAQLVAMADAAWTILAPRISRAEEGWKAAWEVSLRLGDGDDELKALGRELIGVRDAARADPLTHAAGDPGEQVELDRIAAAVAARHRVLEDALAIRTGFGERVRELAGRIAAVAAAEDAARAARDLVLVKIASPVLPGLPDQAGTLRDRLAALGGSHAAGDWAELARRTGELERAVADALAQAHATTGTVTGLIDRRDELRGRLEAFRAKAVRLGAGEDAELGYLYRQAHDLLWTAPCDLRQATVAMAGYQRAIKEIGAGG
ncbi:hypothetical protein [Microtetraspora sp. NBRC 13810]|uniref:hypothetical protein n=1 Tax=Microtetraspora sp. NBRC 13810 TaxID=3030990 RepID=UPI002554FE59|nr:hypothetical protein [Microtetraspora sp. NBRC 13810]